MRNKQCGSGASCAVFSYRPPKKKAEVARAVTIAQQANSGSADASTQMGRSSGGTQGIRELRIPHVLSSLANSTWRCSNATHFAVGRVPLRANSRDELQEKNEKLL